MTTPNMDLVEIVPGVTAGPQYATDIVSNFSTIDAHDHTTGAGVKVPVAGMNINGDLPFGGNGATGLGRSQYNSLGAALSGSGNYRSVHVVSGELFYLDASGNAVQLTSGGSVAGSAGNITGLSSPASVTFSTNKYIFKDTATSFAVMESADVRLFEDSASAITNYVALKSPDSLAATYTLTFPGALPADTRYMASSSGGALSFETADTIGSAMTSTGANSIFGVTTRPSGGTTPAAREIGISASCGSYSTSSATFTAVTNLSLDVTASGNRPVFLTLLPDASSSASQIGGVSGGGFYEFAFFRDSTQLGSSVIGTATGDPAWPPGGITQMDFPSAGTYTYTLRVKRLSSDDVSVFRCVMASFEL